MYNTLGITKGLSLTKIIGGLSKTLQIANQVIPLYQKTKPLIHNARSILGVLKETTKTKEKSTSTAAPIKKEVKTSLSEIKKENTNSPTFFL